MPIIQTVKRSADRMNELITKVMDFAKTRMGDGIGINLQPTDIVSAFEQVVRELQLAFPGRNIYSEFKINRHIRCDGPRLSQLLSNLLANALTHGAPDEAVYIKATVSENILTLSVINKGKPIPAEAMKKIFHPFQREATQPSQQGLGLGLYIASEIARGHNGKITLSSDAEATKFIFSMSVIS
jgi:sigma-B regulation protein RsbU (phosphoserine phosphatase)